MNALDTKSNIIEEHERRFAYLLASDVIQKPKVSIWMILVPIIFVYFFYRLNQYKAGRHEFVKNYMISRKRALDAARQSLETGISPDLDALATQAQLPPEVMGEYRKFLSVFNEYYVDLLQAKGKHFKALVRSAFNSKTEYLIRLNHLNQIERELNTALRPNMADTTEGFNEIVGVIEQSSTALRRRTADEIFAADLQNTSTTR
jgi:hypothetical protein